MRVPRLHDARGAPGEDSSSRNEKMFDLKKSTAASLTGFEKKTDVIRR